VRGERESEESSLRKIGAMIEVSELDFDNEVLGCKLPVFTCFTTRWCHNCFPTCLIADQLIKEYDERIKFVMINIDAEESKAMVDTYHVTVVPTILLFQNAQPVKRMVGFQDRSSLRKLINSVTGGNET
jgi:thioredoxin 1